MCFLSVDDVAWLDKGVHFDLLPVFKEFIYFCSEHLEPLDVEDEDLRQVAYLSLVVGLRLLLALLALVLVLRVEFATLEVLL